jgi:hypothetical protein
MIEQKIIAYFRFVDDILIVYNTTVWDPSLQPCGSKHGAIRKKGRANQQAIAYMV